MSQNERHALIEQLETDFGNFTLEQMKKHNLTEAEILYILTRAAACHAADFYKEQAEK